MGEPDAVHKDIDGERCKMWFELRKIGVLAVKAELRERAKQPRRFS